MVQFSKECVLEDTKIVEFTFDINSYNIENQLVWFHELLLLITLRDRVRSGILNDIEINNKGYYVFYPMHAHKDLESKGFSKQCLRLLRSFRNNYVHQGPSEARLYFDILCNEYNNELKELANYAGVVLHFNISLYNIVKK